MEGVLANRALVALAFALGAGCGAPPPPTVDPVRLYVAPGLPGALVVELARSTAIANPTLVDRVEDAEVAWLRNPVEALALGARAPPGSAPEQPGVPDGYLDPKRRFAPVGALAWVIITSASAAEPFAPDDLRELADPRVRGKVALARLDRGEGPLLAAALEVGYGERGVRGWLQQLAGNRPIVLERGADVVKRVASREAQYGLTDSLTAGGALANDALRIVFTDQKGSGSVVIPTALVVLPDASAGARRLSAWLAGPVAERLLVARAIGLLPLRTGETAPNGMVPVWRLAVLTLDWGAVAERRQLWEQRLAGWPKYTSKGLHK
jgi:iron(III) transport system substrate-binding protein